MREILFRGKRRDNGEWVEGLLSQATVIPEDGQAYVATTIDKLVEKPFDGGWLEVDPATVGQYTGLTDKNGKRIFEGDILRFSYEGENRGVNGTEAVIFENGKFGVRWGWHRELVALDGFANTSIEVIGNIHDDPELLEDEANG